MNASVKSQSRKWKVIGWLALAAGLAVLVLRFFGVSVGNSDPFFRGKPESEWINSLKSSNEEQTKEWRGYGEEGIQVLIRQMERASRGSHPIGRAYNRVFRSLPVFIARFLPYPKEDTAAATRERICALIVSLGKDARSAIPIMTSTLRDPESDVQQLAIEFFVRPPNGESVLSLMNSEEKAKLLPELIRIMGGNASISPNVIAALKYFPEYKETLTPLLLGYLQNTHHATRVSTAEALDRIDPAVARTVGAATKVVEIANDVTSPSASYATRVLGRFEYEHETTVPGLIACLQSTDSSIVCEAIWVLEKSGKKFDCHANSIVIALSRVAERNDDVGKHARVALKCFQTEGQAEQVTK